MGHSPSLRLDNSLAQSSHTAWWPQGTNMCVRGSSWHTQQFASSPRCEASDSGTSSLGLPPMAENGLASESDESDKSVNICESVEFPKMCGESDECDNSVESDNCGAFVLDALLLKKRKNGMRSFSGASGGVL